MILSASRRTDIPALYARWFSRRLHAGYCLVPNPYNARQVTRLSLAPEDIDAIVFWTRHARPLFSVLPELDRRGIRYYFQYTITGYGRPLEARTPPLTTAVATFRATAERLPEGAVVWRYDPILLGSATAVSPAAHRERFARIAGALQGRARRVVLSLMDCYKKTDRRVGKLYRWGTEIVREPARDHRLRPLLGDLARIARDHGLTPEACAEAQNYSDLGIRPTKCIDDRLLAELFGGTWTHRKDPGQRPHCGCVPSRDLGVPDSCTFGCVYCYATRSDALARRHRRAHDLASPVLWSDGRTNVPSAKQRTLSFS